MMMTTTTMEEEEEDMEIENDVNVAYEIDLDYEFDAARFFDFTDVQDQIEGGRTGVEAVVLDALVEGVAESMEVAGASNSIGEREICL
ncbi:hypothetical protein HN51_005674 [Arachis hypogaea]|nr:protein-like isoform [Arachis hypogaea]